MCEFVSWIEYKGDIYFLDKHKLGSRRGRELKEHDNNQENWQGHGAICWFYGIERKDCIQREITDFSDPCELPPVIVDAIKNGDFECFMPDDVSKLLTCPALAEHKKIEGQAWAEYKKIEGPALAEYKKIEGPALAEYKKIKGPAWAEYKKIEGPALAEYKKIEGPAWAEYKKIEGPAWAEYEKIRKYTFWKIFSDPDKRADNWR